MSRVLVRLTFQSEYTESERFLSPLTVPSCSALPAGSPVDVGSFVRISSIILCGGFCSLLIKSCPGEVSFCQAFYLPLIIKEKADPEVVCRCDMQLFLLLLFLWADKEKKSIFAFSQKYFVILLILRKKRVYISLFFLKVPTECTPRPIEKCNCTFSFSIWIYETMLHI